MREYLWVNWSTGSFINEVYRGRIGGRCVLCFWGHVKVGQFTHWFDENQSGPYFSVFLKEL